MPDVDWERAQCTKPPEKHYAEMCDRIMQEAAARGGYDVVIPRSLVHGFTSASAPFGHGTVIKPDDWHITAYFLIDGYEERQTAHIYVEPWADPRPKGFRYDQVQITGDIGWQRNNFHFHRRANEAKAAAEAAATVAALTAAEATAGEGASGTTQNGGVGNQGDKQESNQGWISGLTRPVARGKQGENQRKIQGPTQGEDRGPYEEEEQGWTEVVNKRRNQRGSRGGSREGSRGRSPGGKRGGGQGGSWGYA